MPSKSRLRTADLTPTLTPLWHVALADTAIGVTAVGVHSLALPSAGTYLVELCDAFDSGTLGATRNVTWLIGVTNFTSMSMTGIVFRSGSAHQLETTQTSNNHTIVAAVVSAGRARIISTGVIVVSAAAVVTVQVSIAADAGTFRTGSYIRARKYA